MSMVFVQHILPPYSINLNLIEMTWSKLENLANDVSGAGKFSCRPLIIF